MTLFCTILCSLSVSTAIAQSNKLPELYPFNNEDYQYGYMNKKGNTVIEAQFEDAWDFMENGLAIVGIGQNYGMIDSTGKVVVPAKYGLIKYLNEGMLAVLSGINSASIEKNHQFQIFTGYGQWGYLDAKGGVAIPLQFEDVLDFTNGIGIVQQDGKYGMVNKMGVFIAAPEFEVIYPFAKGDLTPAKKDGKWGYLNRQGELVIAAQYQSATWFYEHDLAVVKKECKSWFINKKGETVMDSSYDSAEPFYTPNTAWVEKEGEAVCINLKGEILFQDQYEEGSSFHKGLAVVSKNDKYGYINEEGKLIAPFNYNWALSFEKSDLAPVEKDGKWGYLNTRGKVAIALQYDGVGEFYEELANARIGDYWGIIHKAGIWLIPPIFDDPMDFEEDRLIKVYYGKRQGLVSRNGTFIGFTEEDVLEERAKN